MNDSDTKCLTYKQLAEYLYLSPSTVKKNWRGYPFFFVTEKSRKANSLRGARFDLYKSLKEGTKQHGNSCHLPKDRGKEVRGILQAGGNTVSKKIPDKNGSKRMGSGRKTPHQRYEPKFDVFAGK